MLLKAAMKEAILNSDIHMLNKAKKHDQFLQQLGVVCGSEKLSAISLVALAKEYWANAAQIASKLQYRFVGIWAQDLGDDFELTVCLELKGAHLLLRTLINATSPEIASFTPNFPAANRLERHTHDMFGINFCDHPDVRRWTRHQAWSEKQFPLRKNFPVNAALATTTPPDKNYPFLRANGSGVYEIPVGPVHAGIIEPGHFRFQVAGEDVMNLEEHLGYVHKGIEKIAEGREVQDLIRLASRVSGDSTVAYSWATCMALETAMQCKIPERALYLRAIMCERERVANHLGDFAAICNDVAYTFAYYQMTRLKELWVRLSADIFGHRFMMDCIVPGGVVADVNGAQCRAMAVQIADFKRELAELYSIMEANSGLHDRAKKTGVLSAEQAKQFAVLGYVARASGQSFDLRRDTPYAPYDKFKIRVPVYNTGDVLARLRVRAQEILVAFELIERLIDKLPDGEVKIDFSEAERLVEGVGLVEGWRGEILVFVRLGCDGLVERFFPRDPSWFSWPALEQLIHGNIVPDFPVCNKSINGSYSGVDL